MNEFRVPSLFFYSAPATNGSVSAHGTLNVKRLPTPPGQGRCPCPLRIGRDRNGAAQRALGLPVAIRCLKACDMLSHFRQPYRTVAIVTGNAEGGLARDNERPLDHGPCNPGTGLPSGTPQYHAATVLVMKVDVFFIVVADIGMMVRRSER